MAHLHTLALNQLRYGELSLDEERAARAHLDGCAHCSTRLARQEQQRHAFELAPVPEAIRAAARQPAPLVQRLWGWLGGWRPMALSALAIALALLVVLPRMSDPDTTRLKGAPTVEVLVEGHGLLSPGARLHSGDRVQLRVAPGAWRHAWVGDASGLLGQFEAEIGRATLAPFSLVLDSAKSDERVAVVLSEAEIDRGTAQRAIQGARIPGVSVAWITLPRGS